MRVKRAFDLAFSTAGLVLLSPLFLAIALWIRFDSPGPVLFRQVRVGMAGKPFRIFKFRTMLADAESRGPRITAGEDPRITRAGRFLRRYKLDELPQLLNVMLGQMSLVGPRPELPCYVALYPEGVRERVLSVPPGITDYASIEFREESAMLRFAEDPEGTYINRIMPVKLRYYEQYVRNRSFLGDLRLVVQTLWKIRR
jgi:lipopolysaccharide/colanic/teichoic acid biosynthesis glycosyltransferase